MTRTSYDEFPRVPVDVFVYGTLRTDPEDAERYGTYRRMHSFDPGASQVGELGGWRLDGYGIWSAGLVPAVRQHDGGVVVGDVYSVTPNGWLRLLQYEGYPSLYQFEFATVTDGTGERVARVFTTPRADRFGHLIPSGDYFATPTLAGG